VEGGATFDKIGSLKQLHLYTGKRKGSGGGVEATPGNGQQDSPTITAGVLRS